jgi:hypothetical protein
MSFREIVTWLRCRFKPAKALSEGLSVMTIQEQHFLFFEMTYSVWNRVREQKDAASSGRLQRTPCILTFSMR